MSHHGLLSAEGRCFSFDHRADGYSRGEGVGTIILKPLHRAIRDGDTIRAIVRGTGVNQDGKTQGITLPSSKAQAGLIRDVYQNAGLEPQETMFVEAHGTGTAAGDPIEARALAEVFRSTHNGIPLYVGASKSNLGHLEGGSGIVGLVKAVLILETAIIPPNVNFEALNPQIPAKKWNLKFPTENEPWPADGIRRISVNSFGFGGTNAHCILDDAYHFLEERGLSAAHKTVTRVPTKEGILGVLEALSHPQSVKAESQDASRSSELSETRKSKVLIPISAFDSDGISRNALALGKYLKDRECSLPEEAFCNLSLTMSTRRTKFSWRSFLLASCPSELGHKLVENKFEISPLRSQDIPRIGFIFTGQGAQYQAMGRALMDYPVFRESVEQASEYMTKLWSPWSLFGGSSESLSDNHRRI
jgi:acyl transferase domain-containing protein